MSLYLKIKVYVSISGLSIYYSVLYLLKKIRYATANTNRNTLCE